MKTIEIYEKLGTKDLQSLLKMFEKQSESNEIIIDDAKLNNLTYDELQIENNNLEIDISILRMELNKRLWTE